MTDETTTAPAGSPGPIVVGYDGSPAAKAAVRFARELDPAGSAAIIAATVYRTSPYLFGAPTLPPEDPDITAALRDDALAVLGGLTDEDVRKEAVPGESPAEGLDRLARRDHAQLVAVGVTHRSALGRLLLGGVGDRLLHGAPCPVAVVPAGWHGEGVATIGVAFDGRAESWAALRAADRLATRLEAQLEVIGVYDPAPYLWLTSPAPAPPLWDVDELHGRFDKDLRDVVAAIGLSTTARVRALSGIPGPALVEATRHGIDVLVTGSRGYGPIGGVLLGSVSRYVADHAACPLLVVPRDAGADDAPSAPGVPAARGAEA